MTPRQRVEKALRGGHAEKVPFTVYESLMRRCAAERELRDRGMCFVCSPEPVFKTHRPNVKVTQQVHWEGEKRFTRTVYETPVGAVWTLQEWDGFTSWRPEKMFKGPDDYKTILFLLKDERYEENYRAFAAAERAFGEDGILRAGIGLEPLQALISSHFMGMHDFCIEWMDCRDEVLKLYDAFVANRRKIYPLGAQSPATHANYGGNVVPEIIGAENFARYYVPHYNEAAEALHRGGKLIGCHFDANCRILADHIAGTDLDYVEAFTPAPNSDMSLADARRAWPDKVIWINFPSSVHLRPDADVEHQTADLIEQAGSPDGLLIGITEDMPPGRWRDSCPAIMDGIDRHAQDHPALYA